MSLVQILGVETGCLAAEKLFWQSHLTKEGYYAWLLNCHQHFITACSGKPQQDERRPNDDHSPVDLGLAH